MLQKIENYQNAVKRLEEAIARYQAAPDDTLYRDGLIQRFEFTFELAWKSLKEYMEDQGVMMTIVSPRSVLKEAYSMGIINGPELWNEAVDSRNLMSHIYDESTAVAIADRVSKEFIIPLTALADFYRNEQSWSGSLRAGAYQRSPGESIPPAPGPGLPGADGIPR